MIKIFIDSLKKKGWKQAEISRHTGLKTEFIYKLAHGATCSIETVLKIANAFKVTTDEVLGRTPAKTLTPEEEMLLQVTEGDKEITRAALRCAQGEKLIREVRGERRREKAA